MDYELDRGVRVQAAGSGQYLAEVDGGWVVGGGVNGGYALAVLGNAISTELAPSGHRDPVSVSAYFLTPTRPGPARVDVRVLRRGGRRTTVAATMVQDEDAGPVERLTTLAVYADLDAMPTEVLREVPLPDLPALEDCLPPGAAPEEVRRTSPLLDRFATRLDPATAGFTTGSPSGAGVIQGWFSLTDGRPLDPLALLVVVDALPPATFDLGLPGWAPTLELTAHVRARPAPGPAVVRHETRNVSAGQFEEDCWVWDATGRLVAQSRQLALLPRSR